MDNDEIGRAHNLLLETAEVMAQFKQNNSHIVRSLQEKSDRFLYDRREMVTDMVRSEVMQEMSVSVVGYVRDMENARNQMVSQVRESSSYLNKANGENKEISSRLILIASISMATLIIGGLVLLFFYSILIGQERQDADMVGRINHANTV